MFKNTIYHTPTNSNRSRPLTKDYLPSYISAEARAPQPIEGLACTYYKRKLIPKGKLLIEIEDMYLSLNLRHHVSPVVFESDFQCQDSEAL